MQLRKGGMYFRVSLPSSYLAPIRLSWNYTMPLLACHMFHPNYLIKPIHVFPLYLSVNAFEARF